jgi:succinyl-diaminopimelate desuccinylase
MEKVLKNVEQLRGEMVDALSQMCRIPAIAPESGGEGEEKRAIFLEKFLIDNGFKNVQVLKAKDDRVPCGFRPNIIITVPGKNKTLPATWVVTHTDVVPEGDRDLWDTDPFQPVKKNGKLIGRGVEDNGQAMMASIFAAKAIMNSGVRPNRDIKLALVADEEVGSKYGIKYLIDRGIFKKNDLIVVPDAGTLDGAAIEVVEKTHLQIKVITHGKQAHASRPHKGVNAFRAAAKFASRVTDDLYKKYSQRDKLFNPPFSTFEITKKLANVPNINTIPGEDIFFMDCRVLPDQDLYEILDFMRKIADKVEKESGAKISLEHAHVFSAPPATKSDSKIVKNLQTAIKKVSGVNAKPIGIGGGTCAAFFRQKGLPAAVWETTFETAHEPNEYIKIDNLVDDAKVFALLYLMD